MAGVVRAGKDIHVGHASVTPNPFHRTKYSTGSSNVTINGAPVVRGGGVDRTACGDVTTGLSGNVTVNGTGVHRIGDGTAGHGSWVGNAAASGSTNVFANGNSPVGQELPVIPVTFYSQQNDPVPPPIVADSPPPPAPIAPPPEESVVSPRGIVIPLLVGGTNSPSSLVYSSDGTLLTTTNLNDSPGQINTKLSSL